MSSEMKDITRLVLERSEFHRDIAAVRKTCMKLPMVSDCEVDMSSFKGRPADAGRFEIVVGGTVRIKTRMKVGFTLDAEGTGEIDSSGQNIEVKNVRILNDFQGLLGRILAMRGFVAGRTLKLRDGDSALIRTALV